MRVFLVTLVLTIIGLSLNGQPFSDATPVQFYSSPYNGCTKWADMDNDGKLELVYAGYVTPNSAGLMILKEVNGVFQVAHTTTDFGGDTQVVFHNFDINDYDADGDLDLLVRSGNWYMNDLKSKIIRNNGNFVFEDSGLQLPFHLPNVFWGDSNNDGKPDILHSGSANGILFYQDGKFDNTIFLSQKYVPFQAWADMDSDGDLDVIQTRKTSSSYGTFDGNYLLTRKPDGTYSEKLLSSIPGELYGAEFNDYDSDGDLDMLLKNEFDKYNLFRSDNGNFYSTGSFPKAISAKWADFNNDGYADIIFTGGEQGYRNFVTRIYYNNKTGGFSDSGITSLPAFERGTTSVADFDMDGDVDIALLGDNQGRIFKNLLIENGGTLNSIPATPQLKPSIVNGNSVSFEWDRASDAETPTPSLSYNLFVRKEGGGTVVSNHHNFTTSTLLLSQVGNMHLANTYKLGCLQEGTYFWSMQSLDQSFRASLMSAEQMFSVTNTIPAAPTELVARSRSDYAIQLTWKDNAATETEYVVMRKIKDDPFNSPYLTLVKLPANTTSFTDTLWTLPDKSYLYKVIASNCSYPSQYFQETEGKTFRRLFDATKIIPFAGPNPRGRLASLADYDHDKDLDLLLTYQLEYKGETVLFKYEKGAYVDTGLKFPYLDYSGSVQWIDYNKDSYLDLLFVVGQPFSYKVRLFLNDGEEGFVEVNHSLFFDFRTISQNGLAFEDFDRDTDLDLLIQGTDANFQRSFKLLLNDGNNQFTDSKIMFDKNLIVRSTRPWGDYDNDGYPDLLVCRKSDCTTFRMKVLKNIEGRSFQEVEVGAKNGLNDDLLNYTGDSEWGDYDNDGYLDFMISGQYTCGNGVAMTEVYHNNRNNSFSKVNTPALVQETYDVNLEWADYDNDGSFDIFQYGDPFGAFSEKTRLYRYNGSSFIDSKVDYLLESVQHGAMTIGDIDNDHDIDCIILGQVSYTTPSISVFKNNVANAWGIVNRVPSAPTNLRTEILADNKVRLSWDPASDSETSSKGLTYNIYFVQKKDTLIMPGSHWNGYRQIVGMGNVQHNTSIVLSNMTMPGNYTWAVQAIDKSYQGGPFSAKQEFIVTGIEDEYASEVSIFPVPARDVLTVRTVKPAEASFYNSVGVLMQRTTIPGEISFSIANWANGLYVMKYVVDGRTHTKKIIKE